MRGGGRGAGRSTKKIFAQGKIKFKKIHPRQLILKKYLCYGLLWPKKNSYKEFDNEKKFLRLENSPPPLTFLMVRPLHFLYIQHLVNMDSFYAPLSGGVSLYKQQKTDNEWLVAYGMTLIRVY